MILRVSILDSILNLRKKSVKGIGIGSTEVLSVPSFARPSTISFPWIPTCEGIQTNITENSD